MDTGISLNWHIVSVVLTSHSISVFSAMFVEISIFLVLLPSQVDAVTVIWKKYSRTLTFSKNSTSAFPD